MKNEIPFVHLHVHTEYSALDGFGSPIMHAEKAASLGHKYLAITDHGNIDGLIKFQGACETQGIKPILGCEAYIVPDIEVKDKKRGHITLWIKNRKGFGNICKMLTFANTEGFYYKPRISHKLLLENCEGLAIGTACLQSFLYSDGGIQLFSDLYDIIGNDLYCEIMPHQLTKQIKLNRLCRKIARRHGCKIVATNDAHYINRSDCKAQEVLLAIQRKAAWTDKNRFKFSLKTLHLRSTKEMKRALIKQGFYKEEYLTNTIEVAEKCGDFRIAHYPIRLPKLENVIIDDENEYLERLCTRKYRQIFKEKLTNNKQYYNRFEEEYSLIKKKKFVRYFLIVWEFIGWCKQNDIMVGPGRGSVGGSLIAFLLNITTVDPIKHNLLFSRFMNEDRIDLPDIDIDIEYTKRDLARQHLEQCYGYDNVAGVSSFNRMKAKAVIRDVSRVFAVPLGEVNQFAKLVEDNDQHTGIQDTIDSYEEGREFEEKYPKVIKYAKKLEGQVRGYSQHAAALVISKRPIGTSGRCNLLERDGVTLINWEKDDTEYVGLLKLDILGLKLLSVFNETRKLVKEAGGEDIDFNKIDLNDKKVIEEINKGNTVGAFQLGTPATTSLIKAIGVENFKHISDAIALVRPGPTNSGMTEEYVARKHGKRWKKMNRIYEEITKDTYGILVYQEQVINVINKVAGLPYSTADKIRKIIGKKRDVKEFRHFQNQFIKGCLKEGTLSKEEAQNFWKGLQEWAGYGFNEIHSVEYAILAYWCIWLKKYHPIEFICASLTHGAKNKKIELIEEAYRIGLAVILPKVGVSNSHRWTFKGKKLYIPFIEVKGIGDVKAKEATTSNIQDQKKDKGINKFFNKEGKEIIEEDQKIIVAANKKRIKGQFGKLLEKIGAYDFDEQVQISQEVKDYFDFRIVTNPKQNYASLFKLFNGKIRLDRIDKVIKGDGKEIKKLIKDKKIIKRISFEGHKKLNQCELCDLYKECTRPVPPSPGRYNIAIIGEGPWIEEDEQGEGFVGQAGVVLWKSLKKRGYQRKMFHVTNVEKCYPKYSGKPNQEQLDICGEYLKVELKEIKVRLILALGNTVLQFFTNRKSGISNMINDNRITAWNEEYKAWICWSLHPAATLHNPDNKGDYEVGIDNFCRMINILRNR